MRVSICGKILGTHIAGAVDCNRPVIGKTDCVKPLCNRRAHHLLGRRLSVRKRCMTMQTRKSHVLLYLFAEKKGIGRPGGVCAAVGVLRAVGPSDGAQRAPSGRLTHFGSCSLHRTTLIFFPFLFIKRNAAFFRSV